MGDGESLGFQPWQHWAAGYPPGVLDVDACVNLISDDLAGSQRMGLTKVSYR